MTLSERNVFLKIGIFYCVAVILLIAAASFLTVPVYPEIEENTQRPDYYFQFIAGLFLGNSYYAVHAALFLSAVFSLVGMIMIHAYFERTPTPEILYIAIFAISLSFEALRLCLPLNFVYQFPSFYLRITTKVLLFARFFGIFSLFTAGLCAAGMDIQKARNAILIIFIAALVISLGVPIDVHSWDTGFNTACGYITTFRLIELLVFVTTMASFLIASKIRDSKEYVNAAIGVVLALIGRNILLGTDNWIGCFLGIALLSFGTLFLCSKVHKIYLWL